MLDAEQYADLSDFFEDIWHEPWQVTEERQRQLVGRQEPTVTLLASCLLLARLKTRVA